MNKDMRKVVNKIRTKLWKNEKLVLTEEMFMRNIVAEDIKNNLSFYKNSWNVIISSISKDYSEDDFKTYFLIKSQLKKDQSQFDWLIPVIQSKHMDSILSKSGEVRFQLFKSKVVIVNLDIERQEVSIKKGDEVYIKNYKLSELPLFKGKKVND